MSEVFRSENLVVHTRLPHGSTRVVVTFAPWRTDPGLDHAGFGEAFCAAHGLDAIHVTCAGNDWYQYPEMPQAYAAIRQAAAAYGSIVTYGVSMGGYQAIKAALPLDARRVVAVSPQRSVDPAIVPFETRWPETAGLAFIDDAMKGSGRARYALVYDPRNRLDRLQAALIAQRLGKSAPDALVQHLVMPFAGHSLLESWKEAGVVSRAILTLLKSKKDTAGVRALYRGERRRSARYLEALLSSKRLDAALRSDLEARLEALRLGAAA